MGACAVFHARKPRSPGREVEFLVKKRVVRDVHLPVLAHQRAVRIHDGGGVMINPRRAALEKRGDDDHPALPRDLAERGGRGAGNRLRQREVLVVLDLAKVLRAEKLRQADHVRPLARRVAHHGARVGQVRVRVGSTPHLDDAEDGFHGIRTDERANRSNAEAEIDRVSSFTPGRCAISRSRRGRSRRSLPRPASSVCSLRRRRRSRRIADLAQHVVALDQLAEGGVLAIEEAGVAQADEKLAAGGVRITRAGHRDDAALWERELNSALIL